MNCSICCDQVLENKNKIVLECGHSFHVTCMFTLMSHNDKKCPNCRKEITYQVKENELQERLTKANNEITELKNDNDVALTELNRLQLLVIDANQLLVLVKLKMKENTLQHKIEVRAKELQIKNIKEENTKLREKLMDYEINRTQANLINKLKMQLQRERNKNAKLIEDIDSITTKTIRNAEYNSKMLTKMNELMNNMKNENHKNKVYTRTRASVHRHSSYHINDRRQLIRGIGRNTVIHSVPIPRTPRNNDLRNNRVE